MLTIPVTAFDKDHSRLPHPSQPLLHTTSLPEQAAQSQGNDGSKQGLRSVGKLSLRGLLCPVIPCEGLLYKKYRVVLKSEKKLS